MNQRKAERWLSQYVDGELDARRTALLEAEMERDPALRAQAERWRSNGDQFRRFADAAAPDPSQGWGDVRTALAGERGRARRPAHTVFGSRWGWAAAMLVVLAVVGLRIRETGPGQEVAALAAPETVEVEWAETELPGASTMIFRDEETGLTVVWLVENGDAEDEHAGS